MRLFQELADRAGFKDPESAAEEILTFNERLPPRQQIDLRLVQSQNEGIVELAIRCANLMDENLQEKFVVECWTKRAAWEEQQREIGRLEDE